MKNDWWKYTNIYQVTLKSFYDSNNDGLGDITGLTMKLDYIKDLGCDTIWISPHYESPMDDNGYDVSDYYKVSKDFGTLDDFSNLIKKAHEKNIKIICDLVLNHTSDEHSWFKIASNPNHPEYKKYHNYYIWQKPKYNDKLERIPPTRWLSWFGGPAWDYIREVDEYYLHIFSKKMPDLNWRNKDVRQEMKKIIKFWIENGVDGFRVDAANHLEKDWNFIDDYPGYNHFSGLEKHHEYIKELAEELFIPNDLLIIGESGSATKSQALKYVGFNSHEFNLLIQFGHVWADACDSNGIFLGKWGKCKLRVDEIKKSFNYWYEILRGKGWNLIYWHNHDHPRIVSHYGNDSKYRVKSAKMLAISLYFMPGTSLTYQGEEIGMTNVLYKDLESFRDVEVFTEYKNFIDRGAKKEEALKTLRDRSRDNARSPMQWNSSKYAGFSTVKPWMDVNYNYHFINVSNDLNNKNSILNTYKFILKQRKKDKGNIIFGEIKFIDIENKEHFSYINRGKNKEYLVICNFTDYDVLVLLNDVNLAGYRYFYSNMYEAPLKKEYLLKPYAAYVYVKDIKIQ